MPRRARKWDSLSEFVEYAGGPCNLSEWMRSSRREGRDEFTGTATYAEAEGMAFHWPEGVARVEKMRANIALRNQRVRKEVVSSEAGPGTLAMGKFLAGHPQPYMRMVDSDRAVKGKGKIVRVLINCSASAGVDTEVIERRGAAVLALASALEQTGRRVEIVVANFASVTRRKNDVYDYRVTVKNAHRKLNLNTVVFAVAHPSFLRRFMFAAKEREQGFAGMGRPMDPEEIGPDTIYVGRAFYGEAQWKSDETAAAWVRESLEAQGVKIR